MQASSHINWNEPEDSESPNIVARVSFTDDDRQLYPRSTDITVWLNKGKIKNASLSEIHKTALSKAIQFLQDVLTAHTAENK